MASINTFVYPFSRSRPVSALAAGKLAACSLAAMMAVLPVSAHALDEGVVATVNGEPVHRATVVAVQQQLAGRQQAADETLVIQELINLNLLSQLATEEGLHEEDDVRSVLELQRLQVLANAYMGKLSEEVEISDEQLRAEYDKQVAAVAQDEFNVSQIMLESEADANDVIAKLDADSAAFEELAKTVSIDPGGQSGGEMGWVQASVLPEPMANALAELEPGNFNRTPVQTNFGWHVMMLHDKRGSQVPDFEAVKPQVRNALVTQELQNKIEELRASADIDTGGN